MTSYNIRQKRLRWIRTVANWTVQNNWRHVIFSDEIRVSLYKCDGRVIVWREKNERYVPACLEMRPSQNRNGLMFWGCIGYGGRGHLVELDGNMNGDVYRGILQTHLRPSAREIFGNDAQFVFQQDNAPPHKARLTINWLENEGIQHMTWPPYSPDLNIIETVWGKIMTEIRRDPPRDINALRNKVRAIWENITPQYLRSLYAGLPRRVNAALRARGYPTKY